MNSYTRFALLAFAVLLVVTVPVRSATVTSTPETWRQDLQYLAIVLTASHPNLFFHVSRPAFDKAVSDLDAAIARLSDEEIMVGMARIVALVGDAHTSLSLQQTRTGFRTYPVRLKWFQDGLYVTHATADHRDILGRKVVRIGNQDVNAANSAVAAVISHENDPWELYISETYLAIPEVLSALHIVADKEHALFVFEDPAGGTFDADLAPSAPPAPTDFIRALDVIPSPIPLYYRDSNFNYWFRYLSDTKTVFIKYNRCQDSGPLPFSEFSTAILDFLETYPLERLVFDVRDNTGGDSNVITPLFLGINDRVIAGKMDIASQIFSIIAKATFSSGMLNAGAVQSGGGRLVGEPSGGKPNGYGEVRSFSLPNSQLVVNYSTRFIQSQAQDNPSLVPDIPAGTTSRDHFAGNDPSLDALLQDRGTGTNLAPFTLGRNGGLSLKTTGSPSSVAVGYGTIVPRNGEADPAGMAIFTYRPGSVTVTEATVPAATPARSGLLIVDLTGAVKTGIAIANSGDEAATLTYRFIDTQGQSVAQGATTLAAHSQISRFLDEAPFSAAPNFTGTFSFIATQALAVLGLRGRVNERSEFLITTLPLSEPAARADQRLYLPQFADGGGWTTQLSLVNPTDNTLRGTLQFFDPGSATQSGAPATLTVGAATGNQFAYEVPPQGSQRFTTSGAVETVHAGSVWIVPAAGALPPQALGVFSFARGGVTVSEAGLPAVTPAPAFRLYAEYLGSFRTGDKGSIGTGVALANPSDAATRVNLELRTLTGDLAAASTSVLVPGRGQVAVFLHEVPGFTSLAAPFQGILRVTAEPPGVTLLGLRGRYNERGDFLMTSILPLVDGAPGTASVFPHLVDGAGYVTQTILLDTGANQGRFGVLKLFSQVGVPWSVDFR